MEQTAWDPFSSTRIAAASWMIDSLRGGTPGGSSAVPTQESPAPPDPGRRFGHPRQRRLSCIVGTLLEVVRLLPVKDLEQWVPPPSMARLELLAGPPLLAAAITGGNGWGCHGTYRWRDSSEAGHRPSCPC